GGLPDLPLTDREVDVTFCVEVIEHAGNRPEIVRELGRVTRDLLVISTPNRNFPVINHDTRLPFCHWLPLPIRTHYAALFGRKHLQEGNLFWSLAMISAALPDFERESRFLQFSTYRQFLAADRRVYRLANSFPPIGRVLRRYLLGISALIGRRSIHLLPNIASTFRRERNRQI
ncbi:MAG TPA: methyltransferase domain-containing protein, partial [Acetobacteraceae bacterium]